MREPDFNWLAQRLLKSGIAPKRAHRAVNEIRDHYDDLVDAAVDSGASSQDARQLAASQLGSMDDLVAAMSARRELKTWAFRFPRVAVVIYPLACLAVLPAAPVFAGVANASVIARWSASLLAAGLFTATLLLVLQLSILFG
ncbi:MAG: permease prefix domain 1-containing protein [Woeseiaceae bacterium]